MKVGPLLIAGLAASVIGTAGGCGITNSLLGREQSSNQWLQQNQARIFQEEAVLEPKIEPFTHFAAGQLLEGKKRIHQAIIQYRKAIDLNSKFIGAYNRLAVCLDKIGRHTEAESTLRHAIKVNPNLAYLRNNLAFSLMAQKRWSDSERELRAALQLKPDYQRARVNLGIVMSRLARRDEAFQQFQMVLGDARAHYNMGLLDKAGGRYAQAAESFRNALALEPNLTAAKIQLQKLRTMVVTAVPRQLERQADRVVSSRSVVATRVPPRQPPPSQTVRVAVEKQQVQEQEIVAVKSPATPPPRESHEQDDAVVETLVAAQAEPDIAGMSIGRSEDPVCADEMEDNGADFSWEVADVSATAPRAAGNSPAPVAKVERPAPKTEAEVPTVVAVAPTPVRAHRSDPMQTPPAAQTPEPTRRKIETASLPFFTYEEPCEVRNAGRFAPQPQRRITPCAEDELIDKFMLGDSGFDFTPGLATAVPQPALAANADGRDAAARDKSNGWSLDEWRQFAREHHSTAYGRNLPSVLMRLQGALAKNWRPLQQPTGDSPSAPTMPNPAAEIEQSVTRAP